MVELTNSREAKTTKAKAAGIKPPTPPAHDALVRDLTTLRQKGITQLRGLKLDALTIAATLAEERRPEIQYLPQSIEDLLRAAIDRMDGGRYADSAELLFGLAQGSRGTNPTELRREAADRLSIAVETFRKDHERTTVSELAEAILAICRDQSMREARLAMMDKRRPAESRLAVQWVERFEAYYRVWTPVYALAADLSACRATLLDDARPFDLRDDPGRRLEPMALDTEPYSQEYQAEGYVRFAIYRMAQVLEELQRFQVRHGGLWLLSDAETEVQVRDALHRLEWHTPINERDGSWMRMTMHEARGELHMFQHLLDSTTLGAATHGEWQEWAARCQCSWDISRSVEERGSYFATLRTDEGVREECALHQVVLACCDYLAVVDRDWLGIADWYGITERASKRE